jgi:hypothetical protein
MTIHFIKLVGYGHFISREVHELPIENGLMTIPQTRQNIPVTWWLNR